MSLKLINKPEFKLSFITLMLILACSSIFAGDQIQEFHMQNAEEKLKKQQYTYAWGELAYILNKTPNHHLALQHMREIAPIIHQEAELQKYLERALKLFPEDQLLKELYSSVQISQSNLGSKK